jgi:hypothetical protein
MYIHSLIVIFYQNKRLIPKKTEFANFKTSYVHIVRILVKLLNSPFGQTSPYCGLRVWLVRHT